MTLLKTARLCMGLLPDIDYAKHMPKVLSLLGYDGKTRELLTAGILDAIKKVNDADRRATEALEVARRTEAMVRELHAVAILTRKVE